MLLDELDGELNAYLEKWAELKQGRTDEAFFDALRPVAVCWKAEDLTDFDNHCAELRDLSEQVHLGWVNERWLATYYLKEPLTSLELRLVKIYQRRPGSSDAAGLDHMDFLIPDGTDAKGILALEDGLEWTEEANGHCQWLSLWFAGSEAKLRSDTVLQVCADEMLDYQKKLVAGNE